MRHQAVKWTQLAARWARMLVGRSYYHVPQNLGKAFIPGRLEGYFNDLTAKARWCGPVDDKGIPVNVTEDGRKVYFATTIAQKALGHWDMWVITKNPVEREVFLKLGDWLVENQDERGGWPLWSQLGLNLPSPYSAMTQGEGISVLVRAWSLTRESTYLEAARRALEPLLRTVEEGGTRRAVPEGCVLEEAPSPSINGILNGWVFALFGLYDYSLVQEDSQAHSLLRETLETLVVYLPRYNAGYWSFYDLTGSLASPFYHRLHIAQLHALELAFPAYAGVFRRVREGWTRQLQSPICRIRAVGVKAYQKLKSPPEVVLE